MNGHLRALLAVGLVTLLAGCVPTVGVAGESRGGHVFFSIFSCAVPWHKLPLSELAVYRAETRSWGGDPECRLVPARSQEVLTEWPYGTAPDGFRLAGECAPLVPGEQYVVDVFAVGFGRRSFQLEDDGDLRWDTRFACW